MSEKEAINELTSEVKWYIPHLSQSWASQFVANYQKGKVKQKTVDKVLSLFGYEIQSERTWIKNEVDKKTIS